MPQALTSVPSKSFHSILKNTMIIHIVTHENMGSKNWGHLSKVPQWVSGKVGFLNPHFYMLFCNGYWAYSITVHLGIWGLFTTSVNFLLYPLCLSKSLSWYTWRTTPFDKLFPWYSQVPVFSSLCEILQHSFTWPLTFLYHLLPSSLVNFCKWLFLIKLFTWRQRLYLKDLWVLIVQKCKINFFPLPTLSN